MHFNCLSPVTIRFWANSVQRVLCTGLQMLPGSFWWLILAVLAALLSFLLVARSHRIVHHLNTHNATSSPGSWDSESEGKKPTEDSDAFSDKLKNWPWSFNSKKQQNNQEIRTRNINSRGSDSAKLKNSKTEAKRIWKKSFFIEATASNQMVQELIFLLQIYHYKKMSGQTSRDFWTRWKYNKQKQFS